MKNMTKKTKMVISKVCLRYKLRLFIIQNFIKKISNDFKDAGYLNNHSRKYYPF